ncbi:MAG TPA: VWA domain-containing protein [Pyrinomonadaceae bacterium]|nr:VWA domain-containing protein [Pyrinomonadaceae bacterium]
MRPPRSNTSGSLLARLVIALVLSSVVTPNTNAQSGRRKGEQNKNPTSIDATSAPTSTTKTDTAGKAAQEKKGSSKQSAADSDDVVRVTSNLVPVPASVVDTKGSALTKLKIEDFELRVDGEVKPISELSYAETPVRLAMLFDNSGSLLAFRDIEKHAASGFFRRVLRPVDLAAIYSVSTDYYLAQPLTNDIRRLEETIAGFGKPEGGTALLDALVEAASYLRPYHGRKVIVIVSDGADTVSQLTFETALQRILSEDCEVYVVQTGLYDSANVRDLAAERRMETLSMQTGGAVYLPKTTPDLETAFDEIAADLAQQYILSYYAADQTRDGRYHTLVLRVKTRNDARVRSRRGFYAPRAS